MTIRALIAGALAVIGINFIRGATLFSWISGGICLLSGIILFWAIFTGKFKEDKKP